MILCNNFILLQLYSYQKRCENGSRVSSILAKRVMQAAGSLAAISPAYVCKEVSPITYSKVSSAFKTLEQVAVDHCTLFVPLFNIKEVPMNSAVPSLSSSSFAPDDTAPCVPLEITEMRTGKVIKPNSRQSYEFEGDGFVGRCMFKFKTDPGDPHFDKFFNGSPFIAEASFQGKLKHEIKGDILFGAELPGDMQLLNFFFRGLLYVLMPIVKYKLPGAKLLTQRSGDDYPQIVGPITSYAQSFIATSDNEEPPQMSVEGFQDDLPWQDRKKRIKFNTEHTYSFSFATHSIDFIKWQIVNFGHGVKPFSLNYFFGDVDPMMVAYFYNEKGEKTYLFKIKFKHLNT